MPIPHPHPSLQQPQPHRVRADLHPPADPCQRPPQYIQPRRLVDLVGGEAGAAHLRAVALEDLAHRLSGDAEAPAQLVDRGSCFVGGDDLPRLVALDLLGAGGEACALARSDRCRGIRELAQQRLQCLALPGRVRDRSCQGSQQAGPRARLF